MNYVHALFSIYTINTKSNENIIFCPASITIYSLKHGIYCILLLSDIEKIALAVKLFDRSMLPNIS